jgi:hypothetical protein
MSEVLNGMSKQFGWLQAHATKPPFPIPSPCVLIFVTNQLLQTMSKCAGLPDGYPRWRGCLDKWTPSRRRRKVGG